MTLTPRPTHDGNTPGAGRARGPLCLGQALRSCFPSTQDDESTLLRSIQVYPLRLCNTAPFRSGRFPSERLAFYVQVGSGRLLSGRRCWLPQPFSVCDDLTHHHWSDRYSANRGDTPSPLLMAPFWPLRHLTPARFESSPDASERRLKRRLAPSLRSDLLLLIPSPRYDYAVVHPIRSHQVWTTTHSLSVPIGSSQTDFHITKRRYLTCRFNSTLAASWRRLGPCPLYSSLDTSWRRPRSRLVLPSCVSSGRHRTTGLAMPYPPSSRPGDVAAGHSSLCSSPAKTTFRPAPTLFMSVLIGATTRSLPCPVCPMRHLSRLHPTAGLDSMTCHVVSSPNDPAPCDIPWPTITCLAVATGLPEILPGCPSPYRGDMPSQLPASSSPFPSHQNDVAGSLILAGVRPAPAGNGPGAGPLGLLPQLTSDPPHLCFSHCFGSRLYDFSTRPESIPVSSQRRICHARSWPYLDDDSSIYYSLCSDCPARHSTRQVSAHQHSPILSLTERQCRSARANSAQAPSRRNDGPVHPSSPPHAPLRHIDLGRAIPHHLASERLAKPRPASVRRVFSVRSDKSSRVTSSPFSSCPIVTGRPPLPRRIHCRQVATGLVRTTPQLHPALARPSLYATTAHTTTSWPAQYGATSLFNSYLARTKRLPIPRARRKLISSPS